MISILVDTNENVHADYQEEVKFLLAFDGKGSFYLAREKGCGGHLAELILLKYHIYG